MKNSSCWCGNSSLVTFSPEYLRCPVCETLVVAQIPDPAFFKVTDDEQDFYGRNYWLSHQEADLNFTNIRDRARTDLTERDLYWLRTLLKYRRPPARSLELGCAHGGFVALLRWAGFEAIGLELSNWVVDFARATFGVPVLLGPLEEQTIAPASLDFIALMDVLEHLPDPVATMQVALDLLAPGGFLLIQTPCYPEGKSYQTLLAENNPFLSHLKPAEHLYLFSQSSVHRLFEGLGAPHTQFETAIFAQYDMCLLVSKSPLKPIAGDSEGETALDKSPDARLVQALLDLEARLKVSEADRQAHLEVIQTLDKAYKVTEADRQARLQDIAELQAGLAATETDRQVQLSRIAELEKTQVELTLEFQAWQEVNRSEANNLREQLYKQTGCPEDRIKPGKAG